MVHKRKNEGVCSISTQVELDDNNIIQSVVVLGGCNGNLKGICRLLAGMPAEDAIIRLQDITCKTKSTSCPSQIALCLKEAIEKTSNIL